MKPFFWALSLVTISFTAYSQSQDYNVPYKHYEKYVLINQNGIPVLDNTYDDLKWISDKFFMGTTKI